MTPEPDAVGSRMARMFDGDDVPRLDREAVEPIRELLREGDWASAAQYAAKVLDSLGIDRAGRPSGRPETQERARRSGRAEVVNTGDSRRTEI
jgi:hypothetical protein